MKKTLLLFFALVLTTVGLNSQPGKPQYHGFYLSLALGGSYLSINDAVTNGPYQLLEMKGSALPFDIKLGYALSEQFILHGDLIVISSLSIDVTADGQNVGTISGDNTVSILMFGVGSTYYFLPGNIFISGTIGAGSFSITQGNTTTHTNTGLGLYAKLGKEWRISQKWNIGINLGFNYTGLKNNADYMTETIKGTSIGLSLNASRY